MSGDTKSGSDGAEQRSQQQGRQSQRRQQQLQRGNNTEKRAAKFGTLVFLVAGVGFYILSALQLLIGDETANLFPGGGDEELFSAVLATTDGFLIVAAPLLAIGAAAYFAYSSEFRDSSAKLAAIATAAGVAAISILLLLLAVIFEPEFADVDIGDELVGLIGFLIGNVVIAGLAGYVVDEDPLDVL